MTKYKIRKIKKILSVTTIFLLGALLFQNCGQVRFANTDFYNYDSLGRRIYRGTITLGASKPNPPLNLFFVVDNSASMLGHQIDLGAAFSSVFSSNVSNLSNFDTNIYVFSTASTYNQGFLNSIPNRAPSSITSVPAYSDTANLATVPGSILGIWENSTGTFGTVPFSLQLNPAPVLASTGSGVTSSLFIPKQGTQSNSAYQAQIASLTQDFQNRLSYLNPSNQTAYAAATDVSSGLCTVSRILKQSSNYIKSGDAAGFIIVSDDNDRLNVRNPNNNQCVESVIGSQSLVDGKCGHYETKYNYSASANVTYKSATTFNYQAGTTFGYSYPSSESCNIQYSNGFKYTYTYTAIQTDVTYTKCNQYGDGTCIATAQVKSTVGGNYVGSGTACTQDMSAYVSSPAPGTGFACVANNVANQAGSAGVDANSNGSQCSSQLLASLSNSSRSNIVCAIGTRNYATTNIANQGLNSCSNFCASSAGQSYPGCSLLSTGTNRSSGSFAVGNSGLSCNSACTDASKCGNGTILGYVQSQYGNAATCDSSVAKISSFTVNAGANSDGSALSCASALSGKTVKDSGNNVICANANSVTECAQSLEVGSVTPSLVCTVASTATTNLPAAVNVGCATACSASSGLCNASFGTVQQYLAQSVAGLCTGASNGGAKTIAPNIRFVNSVAATAGCSAKCSDTVSGSCDGLGWGATDGSSVDDYIRLKLGGGACTSAIQNIADTGTLHADSSNPQSVCSANQIFFASSAPYAGTQTNYVAGDATHTAASFTQYISDRSTQVFGANNNPAFAVITQVPGDNLYGTDVGTDYINLATTMGSNQVASIKSNYAVALGNISDFIVKSTQSQLALPIAPNSVVFAVSYLTTGSSTWQEIPDTLWSWSGQTLSISPTAGLQIGDQIQFQYRDN